MNSSDEDQSLQRKKLCVIHHDCIAEWYWLGPNLSTRNF